MSLIAAALRELIAAGVTGDALVAAVERIEAEASARPAETPRQARNRRYYESQQRLKASENVLKQDATAASEKRLKASETSEFKTPLAGATENNLLTTVEDNLSLSLDFARECAGEALANPAAAHGVMILRELMQAEREGCTIGEIGDGIRKAAGWHLEKRGPGTMKNWTLAAQMAREFRDNRLAPPPVKIRLDTRHERPDPATKRAAREGNHSRAFDGALAAAVARQTG